MSMMKIAGKTNTNVAKPFLVKEDGSQIISRPWGTTVNTIIQAEEIRDTSVHTISGDQIIDLSQYPINSLRIRTTLDQDVTLLFYYDLAKNSTVYIDDFTDGSLKVVVPADSNHWKIVTPDDLPLLEYGKYLRFRYTASEAPTTGTLTIYHVGKG